MLKEPDLSAYNLLISTPMMDGRPEDTYVTSYEATKEVLQAHGAVIRPSKSRYCSDLHLSRSLLLSAFVRDPKATHMIFIDADMGWYPDSISRMLLLNRDFLAVAGPKKRYPIEFAFALVEDKGAPMPLYHEQETNVAEVSGVGACFMMLSRACAERMISAYPDLVFDHDGRQECALFDAVILDSDPGYPRRRLSEDYAFCYRWRKLGGKVEILMDVELTHTGAHTFKGSLLGHLAQQYTDFQQEGIVYGAKTA